MSCNSKKWVLFRALPFQQENGAQCGRAQASSFPLLCLFMAVLPTPQSWAWKRRWHHKTEQQDGILRSQIHWAQHSCQLEHSWKLYHNLALVIKKKKQNTPRAGYWVVKWNFRRILLIAWLRSNSVTLTCYWVCSKFRRRKLKNWVTFIESHLL